MVRLTFSAGEEGLLVTSAAEEGGWFALRQVPRRAFQATGADEVVAGGRGASDALC